jgi:adenylyltransferase/sulfurtransferase
MSCAGIIRRNEEAGRAATTPIVASVIGAVEVQEALKLIHQEQLEAGELTSLCGSMFCYEGQHLTTKTVNFKAYDADCAVHECWEPVVSSTLTTKHTVAEVLQDLRQLTGDSAQRITLNDCFVDWVESRIDGQQIQVMKPGRAVADYIEQHTHLRGALQSALYQHEYRVIDDAFPYQELTLDQVGIPAWDILQISTERGDVYIELSKT